MLRLMDPVRRGAVAADSVARVVARGVYAAADLGEAISFSRNFRKPAQ